MFPSWVEKYHTKGNTIRKIKENYYLYKVTSYRKKYVSYPIVIQEYIGKITPEGLIFPSYIKYISGKTKLLRIDKALNRNDMEENVMHIYGIIHKGYFYPSAMSSEQIDILTMKYNMRDLRIKCE